MAKWGRGRSLWFLKPVANSHFQRHYPIKINKKVLQRNLYDNHMMGSTVYKTIKWLLSTTQIKVVEARGRCREIHQTKKMCFKITASRLGEGRHHPETIAYINRGLCNIVPIPDPNNGGYGNSPTLQLTQLQFTTFSHWSQLSKTVINLFSLQPLLWFSSKHVAWAFRCRGHKGVYMAQRVGGVSLQRREAGQFVTHL